MQQYEQASKMTRKQIIINNFIGGVSWAIGGTIGVSVIIGLLTLLSKQFHLIPFIGGFVASITKFVQEKNATGY